MERLARRRGVGREEEDSDGSNVLEGDLERERARREERGMTAGADKAEGQR